MTPHVLKWIDFGVKLEAAKKVTVAEEGREKRKADYTDQYRWGKEKIHTEIGEHKGQSWIDNKVLCGPLPDQLTGKRGEFVDEWIVPIKWGRMSVEDLKSFKMQVEAEMQSDELEKVRSSLEAKPAGDHGLGLVGGSSSNGVQIKKEEKSDADKMTENFDSLLSNLKTSLAEWQAMATQVKEVKQKGADNENVVHKEITEDLMQKCAVLDNSFTTIVTNLQRMVDCKNVDKQENEKLIVTMEKVRLTYEEIINGAIGFGLISEKQASRKGQKRL